MLHQSPQPTTESQEAATSISLAITELLITSDKNQLFQVSTLLNSALIALGHPGIAPSGPWLDDIIADFEGELHLERSKLGHIRLAAVAQA